jgi:hypothetical protein
MNHRRPFFELGWKVWMDPEFMSGQGRPTYLSRVRANFWRCPNRHVP